jgi:hypothetical protein
MLHGKTPREARMTEQVDKVVTLPPSMAIVLVSRLMLRGPMILRPSLFQRIVEALGWADLELDYDMFGSMRWNVVWREQR